MKESMMPDHLAEIELTVKLIVPRDVTDGNNLENIAAYLNDKFENDPEYFGGLGPENIKIINPKIVL